jgi:acetyl-CoA carboxylase carboxyltransferase component
VVFTREVRARALAAPAVRAAQAARDASPTRESREHFERALDSALLEARASLAAEFDAIHSVARAREVGSLDAIVAPRDMRAYLIRRLEA